MCDRHAYEQTDNQTGIGRLSLYLDPSPSGPDRLQKKKQTKKDYEPDIESYIESDPDIEPDIETDIESEPDIEPDIKSDIESEPDIYFSWVLNPFPGF